MRVSTDSKKLIHIEIDGDVDKTPSFWLFLGALVLQ